MGKPEMMLLGQSVVAVGLVYFLPQLLFLLCPSLTRFGQGDNGKLLRLAAPEGRIRPILDAFESLHFRVVGAFWEKAPLMRRYCSVRLVSRDQGTVAEVAFIQRKVRYSLLSTFSSGAIVHTIHNPVVRVFETESFISGGLEDSSPAALRSLHQERVALLSREGHSIIANSSPETIIKADIQFSRHPGRRQQLRPMAGMMLVQLLTLLAAMFVVR